MSKFRETRDSSDAARAGVEAVQSRIVWLEEEIDRLKDVAKAQDDAAGTVTARCAVVPGKGGPVFIVTCPAGDERRLMSAVFAAFGTMIWEAVTGAFQSISPGKDLADAAREFYGVPKDEEPESDEPKAGG